AQFLKNFDGSDTASTEEIGPPGNKILAALEVEAGLVFTRNRLRSGIGNRAEHCHENSESNSHPSHLCPRQASPTMPLHQVYPMNAQLGSSPILLPIRRPHSQPPGLAGPFCHLSLRLRGSPGA